MTDTITFKTFIGEGYDMKSLKSRKEPLSDQERSEVMSRDAVWHMNGDDNPTPAVWKSKDSKGKPLFVSNTHRAMAVEKTLKAAINKFHSFIKGTS